MRTAKSMNEQLESVSYNELDRYCRRWNLRVVVVGGHPVGFVDHKGGV